MQQEDPQGPAFILHRRHEMARRLGRRLFGDHRGLALDRGRSGHRRYHFLYEDLLI